ncbi:conserved hypothetical protein [Candidatus Desulfosporosinus infrequens]|uniref:Uncharacterized protein n=1 Tax=Candidatus Desulfosporosinus infrequens TaxID=2043169 RepID=A0A2U3KMU3_9FIRM|nr:conserved hypothetical protein [Candidatus Desulfosporosinus infrequens]
MKFVFETNPTYAGYVAPYAGAWIEIDHIARLYAPILGRSLRGSVD